MSTTVAVKGTTLAIRYWKELLIGIVLFLILLAGLLMGMESTQEEQEYANSPFGTANVPPQIEKWRGLVFEYTMKYGIPEYTEFLLAIMYQELGDSQTLDIMQSSESAGYPPNAIQDPVVSVNLGVQHFKSVLEKGEKAGVDFLTIVQSYNFGSGYLSFVSSNGKKHSIDLAKQFSLIQGEKQGTSCSDWRAPYCYGDYTYVEKS